MSRERSCVIVVENLPVPFDRRVWQEAQALKSANWQVSVICPSTERYPAKFEELDGIAIYRHSLPLEARGIFAFFIEYPIALIQELRLLIKVYRERGFSVIQACNPPDFIFLAALPFKLLGVRFVYDQHDVSPELFVSKFGSKGIIYNMLLLFERLSFKFADRVFAANDTFREIGIERNGVSASLVETVYSVPDRSRIFRTEPETSIRNGRRFILGYLGIIGDQDGVDHFVRAVAYILNEAGFSDFQAVVVGDGPALASVRKLAAELGVESHIVFAGYLSGDILRRHLSSFDVGVIPDPFNEANDKMSMNKVFEYSALGIPTVSYQLRETMRLLGDSAVYAETREPAGLGAACLKLMQDDALRQRCAAKAADLAEHSFSWEAEAKKYVTAYEQLL
jgi:glycosyltransferase involved in cell wall biosynthesis